MPNGEIVRVAACFDIVRCIKISDQEQLLAIAKLLGINARKASQMKLGNIYITQDCQVQHPAKETGCEPRGTLAPHPDDPKPP